MPSHSDVVRVARDLVDAPFRHQGRARDGIDCVGLLIVTARALGLGTDWIEQPYRRFPPEAYVRTVLDAHLDPAPSLLPGRVVLLAWRRTANHLAIVGDAGSSLSLIHPHYSVGRVVEHRINASWRARLRAIYDFRGLT